MPAFTFEKIQTNQRPAPSQMKPQPSRKSRGFFARMIERYADKRLARVSGKSANPQKLEKS